MPVRCGAVQCSAVRCDKSRGKGRGKSRGKGTGTGTDRGRRRGRVYWPVRCDAKDALLLVAAVTDGVGWGAWHGVVWCGVG